MTNAALGYNHFSVLFVRDFFVIDASRDRIVLIPVNFDFLNKTLN